MITFPVKTGKENAAVSPLFGKAKYFAFYDGKDLTVEKNPCEHGSELISWFQEKGVDTIIIKEMGINPYNKVRNSNIKVFYAGDSRVTTEEVISKYKNSELELLDENRMAQIIKKHENAHTHSHDHDHDHDHKHEHSHHH